jgi:hypothetical protein
MDSPQPCSRSLGVWARTTREISGQDVAGFCYPWGHVDARVVDQVRAAGYGYGCAISRSALTGPYALPRNYIGDADTPVCLWAKGVCHWIGWDYSRPDPESREPAERAMKATTS